MILQGCKVAISAPITKHSGIWVRLLVTSQKDMAQNTQEMFEWVLNAVETFWGIVLDILSKMDETFK